MMSRLFPTFARLISYAFGQRRSTDPPIFALKERRPYRSKWVGSFPQTKFAVHTLYLFAMDIPDEAGGRPFRVDPKASHQVAFGCRVSFDRANYRFIFSFQYNFQIQGLDTRLGAEQIMDDLVAEMQKAPVWALILPAQDYWQDSLGALFRYWERKALKDRLDRDGFYID
jgi:hypothetical protein